MSQSDNDEPVYASAEPQKELVGDTLRKERITRRITVETIAKDLKLNVKYIKALESNEYEGLPADPYVRVYLKSLAKYLSLDSEAILKKFYNERGMTIEKTPKETSHKITISVKQKDESHAPMIIIALVLISALGLFSFIAKKKGWLVPPPPTVQSAMVPADVEFAGTDDSTLADSLIPAIPPQSSDSPDTIGMKLPSGMADQAKQINLRLTALADSVWVQVFYDGVSWKNVVYKDQHRDFFARDSFNINVANISGVNFTCNGKPVSVLGKGVAAFKIDRSCKTHKWTIVKWNSVFAGRL
jgi:hypothetical protein